METVRSVGTYVAGPGFIPQLMLVILLMLVLYAVLTLAEYVVDSVKKYDRLSAVLLSDTYTQSMYIPQDPKLAGEFPLLYPSENEVNGLEFSYAFHLFISPETFSKQGQTATCGGPASERAVGLRHIFHKGNKTAWPLLAPGVFLHSDTNTLRIYMNSSNNWNNYVDIPNIPVGKWFHTVIMMKGRFLDVYINGNVTMRHEFDTVPKLNYGAVRIFNDIVFPADRMPKSQMDNIVIDGPMKGMISRLKYYSFALNYSQIDTLYREEPSKKIVSPSFTQKPPYLHDDWWVTRY